MRSNPQDAMGPDVLGVSRATAETHPAHLFQKVDLHNTTELVL